MSTSIHGTYHGTASPLFWLYVKTSLLTIVTLGIYRFWQKTRMRQYIWSATSGDGDSFEYTGTGLEKFLGFLVAVVILAIYLGIIQMALFYFGIALFREPANDAEALLQLLGFYITLFAVLPLIYFATYRARRYRMARTRWRGLRFGMDNEAWGFALRALGHLLLTILTLGILLPRQTFYLEKYMADRTWYGDAKFAQDGKWTNLYRGMKHIFFGLIVLVLSVALAAMLAVPGLAMIGAPVGYIWLLVGVISYRIYAFNYLTGNKSLDEKIGFEAEARTGEVVKIYLVGLLIIIGCTVVAALVFLALFSSVAMSFAAFGNPDQLNDAAVAANFGVAGIVGVVLYVALLLAFGGIALVAITQPIIAHMVSSVTVTGAEHLESLRQRAADKGADAEGFADALDIGGAI